MMGINILMLSLYFTPDIAANAVIMTELVNEMARRGHKITVVTAFPHYKENKLVDKYKNRLIQKEEKSGITIIRTYLYTSENKNRFIVRLLNYASFNMLSTIAGIFSGEQDIILAPSPPLTIGLSAAIIGFFKRIPYIYNVQDINPDVLIKLGILKNNLFIRFSKWLEMFVYRRAEHITVLSEGFKRNLLKKGVPEDKLSIIPNFIDGDFVRPLPRENSFSNQYQLDDKFVVLYAGNLGHSQNLEHLLECASLMEDKEEVEFVIVGNGSRKPFLTEKARELELQNVRFIPFQPREDVPEIYAAANVSLVTLKRDIALDSVPSKTYTIMASARPVLAAVDEGSDAWNLVQKAECGLCVPPEDPEALKDAIQYFYDNPEEAERMGGNGRNFVVEHNTREVVGEKYHKLLTSLIEE